MTDRVDSAFLYLDPPADGAWNMACDQMLLETADEEGAASVRFYGWSAPVVSLGYFQKLAERETHASSRHCSIVRRSSGGGAIVHDNELTFSIALPSSNRWSKKNNELYRTVHGAIVKVLQKLGVGATEYENRDVDSKEAVDESIEKRERRPKPAFLCFCRRTEGDIVLDGFKVGGSAQRRSRNAILQHTSLLWSKSETAPELPGIKDLSAIGCSREDLRQSIVTELEKSLLVVFNPAVLSLTQEKLIKKISQEKFENPLWLAKK